MAKAKRPWRPILVMGYGLLISGVAWLVLSEFVDGPVEAFLIWCAVSIRAQPKTRTSSASVPRRAECVG